MANITEIYVLAKKLNLQNLACGAIDLQNEKLSNIDYLHMVLQSEVDMRTEVAVAKREKASRLPKKVFDKTKVSDGLLWHIEQLERMLWFEESQNLIFIGKCDKGKTALATYLAKQILKNDKVYYCTIDEFLYILRNKDKKEKQQRIYKYIADCGLIILDDMMYAPISPEDLPMLYRAITFLNETRSFIVITNREMSGWTDAAEDTHLMQTIVDRLTSNSQILRFL